MCVQAPPFSRRHVTYVFFFFATMPNHPLTVNWRGFVFAWAGKIKSEQRERSMERERVRGACIEEFYSRCSLSACLPSLRRTSGALAYITTTTSGASTLRKSRRNYRRCAVASRFFPLYHVVLVQRGMREMYVRRRDRPLEVYPQGRRFYRTIAILFQARTKCLASIIQQILSFGTSARVARTQQHWHIFYYDFCISQR